jgi:CRISPR-associated protein Cmr6
MLPLPNKVSELIGQVKAGYHPGLALDKHVEPPADAEHQKPILERVCAGTANPTLLHSLNERRREALAGAIIWNGRSSGPLTLHLSRATALENAGIALHPIYGFAYLLGSGLKGLARAWAERIWLEAPPQKDDRKTAIRLIRDVFGYAPNSEGGKDWIPEEIGRDPGGSAGAVVFHDGWPMRWPKLIVDVVGVHHPKYYQTDEKEEPVPAPGDWEDPVPTTFLAVDSGSEFEFAVEPRRPSHEGLARQAALWLKAALADWGAGAKTAAGYGRIISDDLPAMMESPLRRRFECTFELVTPAFLAGAFQKVEDCDLRGATLRGQLRWWWRTMHAGHLDPALLRRLETAIWGAAGEGGAVQLALKPISAEGTQEIQMVGRDNALGYLAYGMQRSPNRPWDRPAKPAGSKWALTVTVRSAEFRNAPKSKQPGTRIAADAVLDQTRAALWLLTQHGGVGAKGRKGFGSLAVVRIDGTPTIEDGKWAAQRRRDRLGHLSGKPDVRAPCLERMRPAEIRLRESDPVRALSRVAAAYRSFVNPPRSEGSRGLAFEQRRPLGLPRESKSKKTTLDIDFGQGIVRKTRHPTTVHFHLAKTGRELALRISGFEIDRIVRGTGFFQEMEGFLRRYLDSGGAPGSRPAPGPIRGGPQTPAPQTTAFLFRRGDRVRNADGDEATVVSDVKIGDTEMTVDIDGDLYPEKVSEWQKVGT